MSTFVNPDWRWRTDEEIYRRKLAEKRELAERFPNQRTPVQEPDSVQREKLARRDLANEFHTIRFVELDKRLYVQLCDSAWHAACDVCEELPEIGQIVGVCCRIFNGVFLVHKACMRSVLEEAPMDGFEVIQDRLKNGGGLFE